MRPDAPRAGARSPSQVVDPLLPRTSLAEGASEVVRGVAGSPARPTVPVVMVVLVVLFLLAQHRIDRRDPKLAAAPDEAEPALGFTTVVRRPGSALS